RPGRVVDLSRRVAGDERRAEAGREGDVVHAARLVVHRRLAARVEDVDPARVLVEQAEGTGRGDEADVGQGGRCVARLQGDEEPAVGCELHVEVVVRDLGAARDDLEAPAGR